MSVSRAFALAALLTMAGDQTASADSCAPARCVLTPAVSLPKSAEEFSRLRSSLGKTPRGGAAMLLYSLLVRERNRPLGEEMLTLSVDASRLTGTGAGAKVRGLDASTRRLLVESDRHPWCVRSYISGTSPRNDYAVDQSKIAIRFLSPRDDDPVRTDRVDVHVCSTGAGNCRPLTMVRGEDGWWKAYRFAGLALPCAAGEKSATP
jgi:hypothetical protein